nr:unnamed protein product [Digitaria exilis]
MVDTDAAPPPEVVAPEEHPAAADSAAEEVPPAAAASEVDNKRKLEEVAADADEANGDGEDAKRPRVDAEPDAAAGGSLTRPPRVSLSESVCRWQPVAVEDGNVAPAEGVPDGANGTVNVSEEKPLEPTPEAAAEAPPQEGDAEAALQETVTVQLLSGGHVLKVSLAMDTHQEVCLHLRTTTHPMVVTHSRDLQEAAWAGTKGRALHPILHIKAVVLTTTSRDLNHTTASHQTTVLDQGTTIVMGNLRLLAMDNLRIRNMHINRTMATGMYYGQPPMGPQQGYPQQPDPYARPPYSGPGQWAPPRGAPAADGSYQAPPPASYGPPSQQPPAYGQTYGATATGPDGYAQGYPQQGGQAPTQYGQSAPAASGYPQQGTQQGGYGQYPQSQPAYGDQAAQANANYGYQGAPADPNYGSAYQQSGYGAPAPVAGQTGYASAPAAGQPAAYSQAAYTQPPTNPPTYDQSAAAAAPAQSGYTAPAANPQPAPAKGVSPQPAAAGYASGQWTS